MSRPGCTWCADPAAEEDDGTLCPAHAAEHDGETLASADRRDAEQAADLL